ncbi:MAG TPA: amidohydrolase family protein [Solirubrobacteraceae bacterium]|nr:amidohydrolase family protein [Solirubrobacteraceae bacterium]
MDTVDCDVHCAPTSFDELFPYLSDYWRQYVSEASIRLNGVAHAYPRAVVAPAPSSYSELRERVLAESEPGFVILNCVTGFETHRNPYFSAAVASAINDWMREEFLERDSRLRASLAVSTVSPDDAVAEIERVGEDPRFVQVLLPVRSDLPWGHKNNHAMFEAAQAAGLQVGLHAWGRAGKAPTPSGFTTTYLEDYLGNQPIAQAQVLSFVSEGVFERFTDLRVVVSECGFAWLTPLLWRFDKDWKGVWREVPWVKRRPSEYVREHCRFTTAPAHLPDDPVALGQLLEMMDAPGTLVYASDYPHEHGDGSSALLDRLSEDDRRRVLGGTAAELYGL